MPDIFISHSTADRTVALQVQQYFHSNGATAFLAPFSIEAGKKWSNEILVNLRKSRVVLLLASKKACASPFVNQEFGDSLALNKKVVPVIWDMPPEELPGWMKEFQTVDLRAGLNDLRPVLDSIVQRLQLDKKHEGFLLLAGVAVLLLLICSD